eukprot:374430_1
MGRPTRRDVYEVEGTNSAVVPKRRSRKGSFFNWAKRCLFGKKAATPSSSPQLHAYNNAPPPEPSPRAFQKSENSVKPAKLACENADDLVAHDLVDEEFAATADGPAFAARKRKAFKK